MKLYKNTILPFPCHPFQQIIIKSCGGRQKMFGQVRTSLNYLIINKITNKICPKVCPKVSDPVRKWFEVRTSSDKIGRVFWGFRTELLSQIADLQHVESERSFVRTVRKKNTPSRFFLTKIIY